MPVKFAPLEDLPDLVFGLVGPIGVDLEYISQSISDALRSYEYSSTDFRVTTLMRDLTCSIEIDETDVVTAYTTKIEYANELRKQYRSNDILAALSISAISRLRTRIKEDLGDIAKSRPRGNAFIIRQLKTPEEVQLLRTTYGRQFIQISVYGNPTKREDLLVAKIKLKSNGTKNDFDARNEARELIKRDSKETLHYGQNVTSAFPLGDLFVDSGDREAANRSTERFMAALFGSNEVSPTKEEYGMYLAKTASLRSSDLSRQVGAAIFSDTGEVISLGSNEVPKAGGGTYWTDDGVDGRDFRMGFDSNELNKTEIFADLIKRLFDDKFLSDDLMELQKSQAIVERLFRQGDGRRYKDSRVMDIIEFGRIIHAEMSAICDAARNGLAVRNGTLFVTTFPCHICAKHIVASGIKRLFYLEPYPKSYTSQLHADAIEIDDNTEKTKVQFLPFMGIAPYRYRDLFEKGKRKSTGGMAEKWKSDPRRPIINVVLPTYLDVEAYVTAQLAAVIADSGEEQEDR